MPDPRAFGMDLGEVRPLFARIRGCARKVGPPIERREGRCMSIDLTGGMDPARGVLFVERPETIPRCANR